VVRVLILSMVCSFLAVNELEGPETHQGEVDQGSVEADFGFSAGRNRTGAGVGGEKRTLMTRVAVCQL